MLVSNNLERDGATHSTTEVRCGDKQQHGAQRRVGGGQATTRSTTKGGWGQATTRSTINGGWGDKQQHSGREGASNNTDSGWEQATTWTADGACNNKKDNKSTEVRESDMGERHMSDPDCKHMHSYGVLQLKEKVGLKAGEQ